MPRLQRWNLQSVIQLYTDKMYKHILQVHYGKEKREPKIENSNDIKPTDALKGACAEQ